MSPTAHLLEIQHNMHDSLSLSLSLLDLEPVCLYVSSSFMVRVCVSEIQRERVHVCVCVLKGLRVWRYRYEEHM